MDVSKKSPKERSICIIGAGPAGLGAAEALKEKGYQNVVILEKRNRVGGQALSKTYHTTDGRHLVYELGSAQPVSTGVGIFHQLIKRHHIHIGKGDPKILKMKVFSLKKHEALLDFNKSPIGYTLNVKNAIAVFLDICAFIRIFFRYRKLAGPTGFGHLPDYYYDELCEPFKPWFEKNIFNIKNFNTEHSDLILTFLGTFPTASQLSKYDQHAPFSLLKYFFQVCKFPARYLNGRFAFAEEGYQELWNRVAKEHHVKLGVHIEHIERTDSGVRITLSNGETLVSDILIVACDLNQARKFLDYTDEERQIYDKILYSPGWRGAFIATNLPHEPTFFIEPILEENHPLKIPLIMPEHRISENTYLYTCVIAHDKRDLINEIIETSKRYLCEYFNAEITDWLGECYWPEYYAYFHWKDIKEGIYQKLEALQGRRDTYYVGGIVGGHLHSVALNYAYNLVQNKFE